MPARPVCAASRSTRQARSAPRYREFTQYFPQPGWVEHDPVEIWDAVRTTLGELCRDLDDTVVAIGITNQRETTVVWDKRSGVPRHRAIVWQDRRTAARCDELRAAGHLDLVRRRTGLVLDPYFSGTKLEWLIGEGGVRADPDMAFGTIDSWLLWNLTGGDVHATDPTNASRTMLYDLGERGWSDELADLLHVPLGCLPEILPSSGRFGTTVDGTGAPVGVPVSGVAGDQQAALFGQACFAPGMTKNTYGTGSFVLMNVGTECPPPAEGMLTTVAWQRGDEVTYALEGAIFVTGAAIQWLRDGFGHPAVGGRHRGAGVVGHRRRWRLPRARLHRTRQSLLGSVRTRHHRRHQPRCHASPSRACGGGSHGVPDPRCRRRHDGRVGPRGACASRRRRCVGDGPAAAIAGGPTRRTRRPAALRGDDRARRSVPRRSRRGCVG